MRKKKTVFKRKAIQVVQKEEGKLRNTFQVSSQGDWGFGGNGHDISSRGQLCVLLPILSMWWCEMTENKKADSRFIYFFKISLVKGEDEFSEGETRETKDGLRETCGDIHVQKIEEQELEKEPAKEQSELSEN